IFAACISVANAQSVSDSFELFSDVPGISQLSVSNVTKTATSTSAQVTLRGQPMTIIAFKTNGGSLGALIPGTLKLTDIMPIPQGTSVDGALIKNSAFLYMPKGPDHLNVNTSTFPSGIKQVLGQATALTLKPGFNLFGQADLS
ncbi:hypothetical protein WH96_20925, partial [Kiloniella spongiae]